MFFSGTETIQLLLSLTQLSHLSIGSNFSNGQLAYRDLDGLACMTKLRFLAISMQVREGARLGGVVVRARTCTKSVLFLNFVSQLSRWERRTDFSFDVSVCTIKTCTPIH